MVNKEKILALSWRDIKAPLMGGAEVHTHKMLKTLVQKGYVVIHFSPSFPGAKEKENIDGVIYLRKGNIFSVIWWAFVYYEKHAKEFSYVIDQCNTHRFFTWLYVPRRKRIFYINQLTREIWKYCMRSPMYKVGEVFETWMLRRNRKDKVITISASTKRELVELGYNENNIYLVYINVSLTPWTKAQMFDKETAPTFLFAGRYVPYKGIDVALKAYARVKEDYPDARLWIIGKKNEEFVKKRLAPICADYSIKWSDGGDGDVISWGYISEEKKLELMSRSWALLFPSVREGWGIPITEAGIVGTPSVVFDSPGIRDAIDFGKAGYLCSQNDEEGLWQQMIRVIEDKELYGIMQKEAYDFSAQFTNDRIREDLGKIWKL